MRTSPDNPTRRSAGSASTAGRVPRRRVRATSARPRYRPGTFVLELVMLAAAVAFLFPVYALIVLSLKDGRQISATPLALPDPATTANYSGAWTAAGFGPALASSALVTTASLVALVVLGSTAAYFIARYATRLGYGLYILFLFGIVLPFQLGMIPLYRLVDDMGLLGTPQGLILFYSGIQLPFTVFLYTGFIRALPRDYADAALVDGANHVQAFTRIVFPLLRPITGTVVILNAVFIWNDFLTPLLYMGGSPNETVPVRIFAFVGQYVSDYGLVFAGLVLGAAPVVVVFLALQRYVVKGFTSTLKG